ncbi:hypothetical protein [Sporanaerobacter acetigenes]|uniref:hypothetical protein n=1 Tax=Sporanaerobacter acetigenes TaxID=165813 RepID=UPI001F29CA98|nr:hypothetical protein [Sporanaerobacter acetigenes]
MIDFNILQFLYLLSMFVVLFLCFSKIVLNNFNVSLCINNVSNKICENYIRIHDMTVVDYDAYNKFMIWLFVVEY